MIVALQAVGLWNVAGFALGDGRAWSARGMPVGQAGAWDVEQLAEALRDDAVTLVDVRDDDEWVAGHVRGSHHLPLYRMADLGQLPNGRRTTAVACMAGARAAFAASLLRRAGRRDVVRIDGGGVPDLDPLGISLTPGA
jgi:hydroxyacylglutathione hydrolase